MSIEDPQPAGRTAARRQPPEAYDPVAKFLHWGMALAILGMIVLGVYMRGQPLSIRTFQLFDLHKALGITLLVLAVLRLAWRLYRGAPATITEGAKPWELALARTVHVLLYVLMIAIPILGWIGASASGLPMSYFGLGPIPAIVQSGETLQHLAFALHRAGVWVLVVVIVLHVAGALKRHLIAGDDTLRRMLPFGDALAGRRRTPPQSNKG